MNNFKAEIKSNKIINLILPFLDEAYLVGGYLRDLALGKQSSDIDIVVKKDTARDLALNLAEKLDAHFVSLDETNKIYRVVMEDKITYVDIAECVGENIHDDLKRRDFTINALGYDLKNDFLIDDFNILTDINKGIIREISEKNITDDPLRILRAFRFQSELGFQITDELKIILKKHSVLLNTSAKERINVELVKLFVAPNTAEVLFSMDETGILEMIFPEVKEIKKVPQNSHHHLDLFHHSVETVNQVQKYYENAPDVIKKHFDSLYFGAQKRLGYLKIAAFLHDAGKPQTWQIDPETGRERFIKHDDVGSKLILETLKTLKFSNKQIRYIQKLVKFHIYPSSIVNPENFTDKAIMRFFRRMEDEVFDVAAIAYADRLSARGPEITEDMINNNLNGLNTLIQKYIEIQNELEPLPKLLDGNEIMSVFKIAPGRKLGKIIKELTDAQMSGDVKTKEEALSFVSEAIHRV